VADGCTNTRVPRAHDNPRCQWIGRDGHLRPVAERTLADCQASYQHLLGQLTRLETWSAQPGLAGLRTEDCQHVLDRLDADRGTLAKLPELHRLRSSLSAAGLGDFIAGMAARQASEDFAVRAFWCAWFHSILDHLSLTDLSVGSFSAEAQQQTVREFSDGDRRHIQTTSARVRRAYAENTVRARDQFKDQAALVQHQAGLKRRHMPVRDFVRNAADVLLALKPCWAMSPLVVSQLLPPLPYFDVVIFDEASQITPADAVTSIPPAHGQARPHPGVIGAEYSPGVANRVRPGQRVVGQSHDQEQTGRELVVGAVVVQVPPDTADGYDNLGHGHQGRVTS
jgi:hypothetical protein